MMVPKEKRLLIISLTMTVLLCIPLAALSLSSTTVKIPTYGRISMPWREYPPSAFTYRIFQNSTSAYRINSAGFVDDNNPDAAVVINDAVRNCTGAGQGSVYMIKGTYSLSTTIDLLDPSNVMLDLGGSTLNYIGPTKSASFLFNIFFNGRGTTNFTLTSTNGTGYINGNGNITLLLFIRAEHSSISNIELQSGYAAGLSLYMCRYLSVENVTIRDQALKAPGSGINLEDVQYSNFTNIVVNAVTHTANARAGIVLGDWQPGYGFDGTYFNHFHDVYINGINHDSIYLNSGAYGYQVYNNTFDGNITITNEWANGYDAIKYRPAQNNTFGTPTQPVVIINCTNAISTGTSMTGEALGNSYGNVVYANIIGGSQTSLILCTDLDGREVYNNYFNITVRNGRGGYFYAAPTGGVHDNTIYANFTNCSGGLLFEQGKFVNNNFYCSFSNDNSYVYPDISFYNNPSFDPNIVGNKMYVYAHGTNPFIEYMGSGEQAGFTNGTNNNYVYYPWSG